MAAVADKVYTFKLELPKDQAYTPSHFDQDSVCPITTESFADIASRTFAVASHYFALLTIDAKNNSTLFDLKAFTKFAAFHQWNDTVYISMLSKEFIVKIQVIAMDRLGICRTLDSFAVAVPKMQEQFKEDWASGNPLKTSSASRFFLKDIYDEDTCINWLAIFQNRVDDEFILEICSSEKMNLPFLEKIEKACPQRFALAEIAFILGNRCIRFYQFKKAEQFFQYAMMHFQENLDKGHAAYGLAQVMKKTGNVQDAIKYFREAYDLAKPNSNLRKKITAELFFLEGEQKQESASSKREEAALSLQKQITARLSPYFKNEGKQEEWEKTRAEMQELYRQFIALRSPGHLGVIDQLEALSYKLWTQATQSPSEEISQRLLEQTKQELLEFCKEFLIVNSQYIDVQDTLDHLNQDQVEALKKWFASAVQQGDPCAFAVMANPHNYFYLLDDAKNPLQILRNVEILAQIGVREALLAYCSYLITGRLNVAGQNHTFNSPKEERLKKLEELAKQGHEVGKLFLEGVSLNVEERNFRGFPDITALIAAGKHPQFQTQVLRIQELERRATFGDVHAQSLIRKLYREGEIAGEGDAKMTLPQNMTLSERRQKLKECGLWCGADLLHQNPLTADLNPLERLRQLNEMAFLEEEPTAITCLTALYKPKRGDSYDLRDKLDKALLQKETFVMIRRLARLNGEAIDKLLIDPSLSNLDKFYYAIESLLTGSLQFPVESYIAPLLTRDKEHRIPLLKLLTHMSSQIRSLQSIYRVYHR